MKLGFSTPAGPGESRKPLSSPLPQMATAQLAAQYSAARVGGDFYDFLQVGGSKLLFIFMDIAGRQESALAVAASAQETFRERGKALFVDPNVEDGDAITHLILEINRQIIAAAEGVRSSPAILGCFDESINTLSYINAGHTPALLHDAQGTLALEANGLPLGLFTHATHDSQFCAIEDGAALVMVSRGVIEVKAGGQEFGIERVKEIVSNGTFDTAEQLCQTVLETAEQYRRKPSHFGPYLTIPGFAAAEAGNDMTVVALLRRPALFEPKAKAS